MIVRDNAIFENITGTQRPVCFLVTWSFGETIRNEHSWFRGRWILLDGATSRTRITTGSQEDKYPSIAVFCRCKTSQIIFMSLLAGCYSMNTFKELHTVLESSLYQLFFLCIIRIIKFRAKKFLNGQLENWSSGKTGSCRSIKVLADHPIVFATRVICNKYRLGICCYYTSYYVTDAISKWPGYLIL